MDERGAVGFEFGVRCCRLEYKKRRRGHQPFVQIQEGGYGRERALMLTIIGVVVCCENKCDDCVQNADAKTPRMGRGRITLLVLDVLIREVGVTHFQ